MDDVTSGSRIYGIGLLLITWFAIGILFEVASYIFRKAEWSLLRATLTHYALTCLGSFH